jgi:hypothetical protein
VRRCEWQQSIEEWVEEMTAGQMCNRKTQKPFGKATCLFHKRLSVRKFF